MPAIYSLFRIAELASSGVAKAIATDPAVYLERFSANVIQYSCPKGVRPLLKVRISSFTSSMPSGQLKTEVGML